MNTNHHAKLVDFEAALMEFCEGLLLDPNRGRLLVVWGVNGTGKTHGLRGVARWARAVSPGLMSVPRPNHVVPLLIEWRHWPTVIEGFKRGEWEALDDCLDAGLVILDDIGAGHDPSRVGVDKLCQLLSRRENRWTMVSLNTEPSAWDEVFDRRVASRLFRNSVVLDMSGVPDYATVKQSVPA